MAAWYYQGDGLKLREEAYAPLNLVARPTYSNAPQMGGWFRKKIGATSDFKGLRMRIPNLGGKVYTRVGATTVLTPAEDIYASLERGVIDVAEWVGPHDDMWPTFRPRCRSFRKAAPLPGNGAIGRS